MNASSDKKSAKTSAAPPAGAADLRSRVPAMLDDALTTLLANARRLIDTGSNAQRLAATDLIPVIEAELADRRAKKLAAQPARKARAATPKVRKPKKPKDEDEEEEDAVS